MRKLLENQLDFLLEIESGFTFKCKEGKLLTGRIMGLKTDQSAETTRLSYEENSKTKPIWDSWKQLKRTYSRADQ